MKEVAEIIGYLLQACQHKDRIIEELSEKLKKNEKQEDDKTAN